MGWTVSSVLLSIVSSMQHHRIHLVFWSHIKRSPSDTLWPEVINESEDGSVTLSHWRMLIHPHPTISPQQSTLTCSSGPARPPRCPHTGSSPTACLCWPHSRSNRRRTRCSWFWSRGRCRSCTSGRGPQRSRGRTAACSDCSEHTARTCNRHGSHGCSWCWTPPLHRVLAGSTASPPVPLNVS